MDPPLEAVDDNVTELEAVPLVELDAPSEELLEAEVLDDGDELPELLFDADSVPVPGRQQ